MHFEALYYADRLHVVNPAGDVALCTLWSKPEAALKIVQEAGVDVSPETSRVSLATNLYGNGLAQMLRNLLWNPQIRHIVIVGKNLSGSREWLLNFFEHGLEEVEFLGAKAHRIRNTTRTMDAGVLAEHFPYKIQFTVLGDIGDAATKLGIAECFATLPPVVPNVGERIQPPPIPEPMVTRFPSEPRAHTFVRQTPMEAWSELIFRLYRFGHRTIVAKKGAEEGRVELQNVKIVVENPVEESDETLQRYGFGLEKFQGYQQRILDPVKPADLGYTYGNRLRGHFQHRGELVDSLAIAGDRLRAKPDSRHCYITLWDNSRDLPEGTDTPCFVSAFFRRFEGKLTLTATFRSHNAMEAWPENLYGLIAVQRFVSERCGIVPGAITVVSHSISIDVPSLEKAKRVADRKESDEVLDVRGKWGPRMDPNGAFTTTFDRSSWELIVEHSFDGMKIHEYRGKSAEEIERQLARDVAISEISHALYVGREIARKEFEMKAEKARAGK
jgi:thymidylate synthase